jgi:hypothetical protein
VVIVLDHIDPERRPGKPKGKARGQALVGLERMEEIFQVMKDYRFFKLCLPAVFGMGRYGESFDWLMLKYYEGDRYNEAEGKVPQELAAETAMMLFDLSQVPVLKLSKRVATEHYPNRLDALHPQMAVLVEHGLMNAERVEALVAQWRAFFEKKVPTLYTIQNGDFRPDNFLHLSESIVLLDWAQSLVTAMEDAAAHCWIAMWRQPEWQKSFVREIEYLVDMNPEWLAVMKQWSAVQHAIAGLHDGTLNDAEKTFLKNQLA